MGMDWGYIMVQFPFQAWYHKCLELERAFSLLKELFAANASALSGLSSERFSLLFPGEAAG